MEEFNLSLNYSSNLGLSLQNNQAESGERGGWTDGYLQKHGTSYECDRLKSA